MRANHKPFLCSVSCVFLGVVVGAWQLVLCLGSGRRRALLACLEAPRLCAVPCPVWSLLVRRSGFPSPWCILLPGARAPGITGRVRSAHGGRRSAGLIIPTADPCPGGGAGLAPRRTCSRHRFGVGLGLRALWWLYVCFNRSLTRPFSRTVRPSTGDSASQPGLFFVDVNNSSFGSEDATPVSAHVCVCGWFLVRQGVVAGSGGPASRARCGAAHCSVGCCGFLFGPVEAGFALLYFQCLSLFFCAVPCHFCFSVSCPWCHGPRRFVVGVLPSSFVGLFCFFLFPLSLSQSSSFRPRTWPLVDGVACHCVARCCSAPCRAVSAVPCCLWLSCALLHPRLRCCVVLLASCGVVLCALCAGGAPPLVCCAVFCLLCRVLVPVAVCVVLCCRLPARSFLAVALRLVLLFVLSPAVLHCSAPCCFLWCSASPCGGEPGCLVPCCAACVVLCACGGAAAPLFPLFCCSVLCLLARRRGLVWAALCSLRRCDMLVC